MINPHTDRVLITGAAGAIGSALRNGLRAEWRHLRLTDVQRCVYASRNHAFGCYPITEPVSPALPPRPDSLYGTFKAWGETMLRCYFDRHGIRSVSLRIGTYRTLPIDQRSLATWLSPADVARLVDASLRHPDPGCLVVNGYSANKRLKVADAGWDFLGYRPQDNAEDRIEMLRAKGVDVDGPWEWPEHGGSHARVPGRRGGGRGPCHQRGT